MNDWQDIETAPKDGTPILLCGGADDNADYSKEKYDTFTHSPCRAMWYGDSWLMAWAEAACVCVFYEDPTHWMPLPKPPL